MLLRNALLLGLLLALGGTAAQAQVEAERRQPPIIEVTGETEVSADPDVVTFSVGVTVKDPSPQAAMDQMAAKMEKVLDALRKGGIAQDQMKTSQLSLSEYSEPKPVPPDVRPGPQEWIKGYQATHRVDLKLNADQFKGIGNLLSAATNAGANEIGPVTFGVKDEDALRARGLEGAVRNARSKADALARGAGVTIRGVYRIQESGPIRPLPYEGRQAFTMAAAAVPQPVTPSEITRRVSVLVQYLIGE